MSAEQLTVEYRDIPGFPGYRVGDDGSIWSNRRLGRRYKLSRDEPLLTDDWHRLAPDKVKNGYIVVSLRHNGKRMMFPLHRLVLESFVGPCPEGMEACHSPDRTRSNCRLDNLRWDTRQANSDDQQKHGSRQRGERNGHAKLTESVVREARQRYVHGDISIRKLATEYGISRLTLGDAIRRVTWRHVV